MRHVLQRNTQVVASHLQITDYNRAYLGHAPSSTKSPKQLHIEYVVFASPDLTHAVHNGAGIDDADDVEDSGPGIQWILQYRGSFVTSLPTRGNRMVAFSTI